jgi:SAM-dependent methyltransferase
MTCLVPRVKEGLCLDLGCGPGFNRSFINGRGYQWIGLEVSPAAKSTLCGDGHHLPFRDEAFDLTIAIAVLEHLQSPLEAVREVWRVTKSGARFLGIAGFLEPYHMRSYYHMSHLGLEHTLCAGGFVGVRIWPGWHMLEAQMAMFWLREVPDPIKLPFVRLARYAGKATTVIRKTIARLALIWARRRNPHLQKRLEELVRDDELWFAGSFVFLAEKPLVGER